MSLNRESSTFDGQDVIFHDYDEEFLSDLLNLELSLSPSSQQQNHVNQGDVKESISSIDDIEDVASSLSRALFHRQKRVLFVTDFAQLQWCGLQIKYLHLHDHGLKETTSAMERGSKVHEKLQRQVTGELQPIKITSKEEVFGVKLWNSIHALEVLLEKGVTREIFVVGIIKDKWITGEIDQITLDGMILEDTKTRRCLPRNVSNGEMVQVGMYERIWNALVSSQIKIEDVQKMTRLDFNSTLNGELGQILQQVETQEWNLKKLTSIYLQHFTMFSPIESTRIHYVSGKETTHLPVKISSDWLDQQIDYALQVYAEEIEPKGVLEEEAQLKCGLCKYGDKCEWRQSKAREMAQKSLQRWATY